MRLTSPAFEDGHAIPSRYTCDGENQSPPLAWTEVPEGTVTFALIVSDPDANEFIHWLLTDIPGDATGLPEGGGDAIGSPEMNDFGESGWGGPCPPTGIHSYRFTLYALSGPVPLADPGDAEAVRAALGARALAEAELIGVYRRAGSPVRAR